MIVHDIRHKLTYHRSKDYPKRGLGSINKLIIHHSATMSGSAEAFARYHVNNNGWPGIAYHYVIDKSGKINLTLAADKVGYHVKGQNTSAIGICCTGHYDVQTPPPEQLASLVWLLRQLRQKFPEATIKGHRDYSTKTCPGKRFPFNDVVKAAMSPASSNPVANNSGNTANNPEIASGSGLMILIPLGVALAFALR